MILGFLGIYLALAALFYLRLAETATGASVMAHARRTRWQRARSANSSALRRLRPLVALRLPKRPR